MTTFPQFWFYAALLIAFLLFLLGAECLHALRRATPDFDRGIRWFNVTVLLFLVFGTIYFAYMIELHRKRLDLLITSYPSSRYAPERESFSVIERWVYMTQDQMPMIVTFYQQEAARAGYTVVTDEGATTSRLLFSRQGKQLFLTIENKETKRILYYSEEGDVRIVSR
jgi:hypothetical protein